MLAIIRTVLNEVNGSALDKRKAVSRRVARSDQSNLYLHRTAIDNYKLATTLGVIVDTQA